MRNKDLNVNNNVFLSLALTNFSVGVGGLLAFLFVALKLTGVIGWSWWWVLAPAWIPLVLIVVLLTIIWWAHRK